MFSFTRSQSWSRLRVENSRRRNHLKTGRLRNPAWGIWKGKKHFCEISRFQKIFKQNVCIRSHWHTGLGILSFAHFAQIKWATVSNLLRSLKTNERPWANCSGRSEEMSNHEQIAQVAQRKWATVSKSLRSLKTNQQPWAHRSGRSEKMSEWAIHSKKFG